MTAALALVVGGGLLLLAGIRNRSFVEILQGITAYQPSKTDEGQMASGALKTGVTVPQSVGGLVFPFVHHNLGRTDQGVDYCAQTANEPIRAIANGKVTGLGAPGWPSPSGGIRYTVLDGGQYHGREVYVYERVYPVKGLHVGSRISAGQIIAHTSPGYPCVEIGFSANGVPLSHQGYHEQPTHWGDVMHQLLESL